MSIKLMEPGSDLFESECDALTNAVNCVGVMGAGIALLFKEKFPKMFEEYHQMCEKRELILGEPQLWVNTDRNKHVVNFPTMFIPGEQARLESVTVGLEYIRDNYKEWGIESIAIPALGCGIGGLEFQYVQEEVERILKDTDLDVEVYPPYVKTDS